MTRFGIGRREFVSLGGACLAGVVTTSAFARRRDQVVNPTAPAAASGTLWIGGEFEVSRLGFGAMRITGDGIWGEPKDAREARAVLRDALDLGVDFIDTADAYGPAVSERLIAEALHPYPRGLLIATKGGQTRPGPNQWVPDGHPQHLRAACEGSLRRLKVERIDLYQLHTPDPQVPYLDSVGELAKLQKEGKIRYIGISNVSVEQLAQAQSLVKVVSVQNRYNVADRSSDAVLAACEREGMAFIPWGPLAQRAQASATPDAHLRALQQIAERRQIDLSQAALAWLLARSAVMLPIPGTSRPDHLRENVAAAKIKLTPQEMAEIA